MPVGNDQGDERELPPTGVAGTGFRTTVEANTLALALERPKQSSESSHGAEEDVREEVLVVGGLRAPAVKTRRAATTLHVPPPSSDRLFWLHQVDWLTVSTLQ